MGQLMWCSHQQPSDPALLLKNCSSFDAFLPMKSDKTNKLIATTTAVEASNLNQKCKRQAFLNETWYKMGLIWFRIRFTTVPYLQGCPERNQKPKLSGFHYKGCTSQVQLWYFRKTHLVFTGGCRCLNSIAHLSLRCFWKTCLMSHRGSQRNQEMILQHCMTAFPDWFNHQLRGCRTQQGCDQDILLPQGPPQLLLALCTPTVLNAIVHSWACTV